MIKPLFWTLLIVSEGRHWVFSEGQYFDSLTAGKQYYTRGSPLTRSSHGSFSEPSSYNTYSSYSQKPSYGSSKGVVDFKTISIPVPDLKFPSPVEFKAGVLRSKGRIASGLLHAKAGILRAGANILAQKAAVLDRVAHTIPAVKAHIIKQLKQQSGYGNHGSGGPSYGAPRPSYGYSNQGSSGGGGSYRAPSIPTYNSNNAQSTYNSGSNINNNNNNNGYQNNQNINNNNNNGYQNNQNINNNNNGYQNSLGVSNSLDSYGAPLGNPISVSTNNIANNNYLANANSIPLSSSGINVGNSDSYGSPLSNPLTSTSFISNNNNNNNISPQGSGNSASNNNLLSGENAFLSSGSSQNLGIDQGLRDSFLLQESRNPNFQEGNNLLQVSSNLNVCKSEDSLSSLITDIFLGHEIIPDILDDPPKYPLDLSYKTIRTFPGMHVTADMTRSKPVLHWPYEPDTLYTLVLSNLDINSRRNRTLSEFWHWFVANIPGDSVDNGEVIFELLFPLVLPEGDGDHRFGFFIFKQPGRMDYSSEGGKADNCSPTMSNGRGPFKSTKSFQLKYDLELTASTFLILDYNEASMEIACEWQKCIGDTINLVSPLKCGNNL
uniref:Uncharacterized protein n=1 Tax=Lepeophtheirus salmonis TaxID=72036 RepID=A0A0K2U802_LEPSM